MNRKWVYPHPITAELDRCRRRQRWERFLEQAIKWGLAFIIAIILGYGVGHALDWFLNQ